MKSKEPVCCCGHSRTFHEWINGPGHTRLGSCCAAECRCGTFTDTRISRRREASKQCRESGPKAEILALLEERGLRYFRMNSGDIVVQVGARRRRIIGNKRGTPDILVISPCDSVRILWIEVKSAEGEQSEEQKEFQGAAECIGEHYMVARSKEDVLEWFSR